MIPHISLLLLIFSHVLALNWTTVDQQIQNTIHSGHFSACELGVFTHNATLYKKVYGTIAP